MDKKKSYHQKKLMLKPKVNKVLEWKSIKERIWIQNL